MAEKKFILEAARAAVLATHAAAGLATAGSVPREVARLLRSAEALSRSAVALLSIPRTSSSSGATKVASGAPDVDASGARVGSPGGAGDGTLGTSKRAARRRRGRHSKQMKTNEMQVDSCSKSPAAHGQSSLTGAKSPPARGKSPTAHDVGVQRRARVLARHETLPLSPASTSPSASLVIPPSGTLGSLVGLSARPELNGAEVRFLRFDMEADRFIVEVTGRSSPPIRIKRECFHRRTITED